MSLISVVTTFHNASHTLPDTMSSLLAQSYTNFEHILVDDGSDDNSATGVRESADQRTILVEPGRVGRAEALNVALKQAKGEYVAILDADDITKADRLLRQKAMLDADAGLTLVCANAELIDEDGKEIGRTYFPETHRDLVASLMNLNPFPHSSVMFSRAKALEVGGYNVRCEKSIDYNFYLDLLATGGQFGGHEEPLIRLRSYSTSWGKNDQQGLQIRYGILGLINYFQKSRGGQDILHAPLSDWIAVKIAFDEWFELRGFQQRMEAKKILSNALILLKSGRLLKFALGVKDALKRDPWLFKYRGCGFHYPEDALVFLRYLKQKQFDPTKRLV